MQIQACFKQVTGSLNRRNQEGCTGLGEAAFAVPSMQVLDIDRTASPGTLMLLQLSEALSHCGI
jgi:hypothetical protein